MDSSESLKRFVRVAELGSFTKAAESLGQRVPNRAAAGKQTANAAVSPHDA